MTDTITLNAKSDDKAHWLDLADPADAAVYQENSQRLRELNALAQSPGYEDVIHAGEKPEEIVIEVPTAADWNDPAVLYRYKKVAGLLDSTPRWDTAANTWRYSSFGAQLEVFEGIHQIKTPLRATAMARSEQFNSSLGMKQPVEGEYDLHEWDDDEFSFQIVSKRPYSRSSSETTPLFPTHVSLKLKPQDLGASDPTSNWEMGTWSVIVDDDGRISSVYFDPDFDGAVFRSDRKQTDLTESPLKDQPALLRFAFAERTQGCNTPSVHSTDTVDDNPQNGEWNPHNLDYQFEVKNKFFTPDTSPTIEILFSAGNSDSAPYFQIAEDLYGRPDYYKALAGNPTVTVTLGQVYQNLAARYAEISKGLTASPTLASRDQIFFILHLQKNLERLAKGEPQQGYADEKSREPWE